MQPFPDVGPPGAPGAPPTQPPFSAQPPVGPPLGQPMMPGPPPTGQPMMPNAPPQMMMPGPAGAQGAPPPIMGAPRGGLAPPPTGPPPQVTPQGGPWAPAQGPPQGFSAQAPHAVAPPPTGHPPVGPPPTAPPPVGPPPTGPPPANQQSVAPPMSMNPALPPPPPTTGGPPPPASQQGYAPGAPQGYTGAPAFNTGYDPTGFAQPSAEQVMGQFASLTMGPSGPGQATDIGVNPAEFPRPGSEPWTPPPVEGNADPKYMRLTSAALPNSAALKARWGLPVGGIVDPLNKDGPPVTLVDFGSAGIVRCRKCRTYINPFVVWTDGGRRFRCNLCGTTNEVPVDYFCTLGPDGRRRDHNERPELSQGSVEYVASQEYMVRAPMPPVYFFMIDVSAPAVASGSVESIIQTIKGALDNLPGDTRTQVGFITFDNSLQFYNLSPKLQAPQMLVVTDLEGEPFLPIPTEDLIVNLAEARHVVDAFLETLPTIIAKNQSADSALGSALQAVHMAMSHLGGKLLVFQTTMPNVGAARLKNRDNATLYGTDREHTLRNPEDPFFKKMAAECSRVQICVDVFSLSPSYTDLASLSTLCKYTGGQIYYYPGFQSQRDSIKLNKDLTHNLTRETGWEAVMRIRCSKGLRISSFHGHFFIRSTDLLALPAVDGDKAYAVQISHEENIVASSEAYLQCALLYTSSSGERRIRVHTMKAPVVSDLGEMYKTADGPATAALLSRLAVEKGLSSRLEDARQAVNARVLAVLKEYKSLYGINHRMPNKLVLPEGLKMVPLYALALTKSKALRGGAKDVGVDERSVVGYQMMAMGVAETLRYLYPTMYALHDMPDNCGNTNTEGVVVMPTPVALATEVLDHRGVYLLDDGRIFICWVGRGVPAEILEGLFGAAGVSDVLSLEPQQDSEISKSANRLLAALRSKRELHQQCFVVRQGEPMETHWLPYLVEDRTQGAMSYTDFLCHLHRNTSK